MENQKYQVTITFSFPTAMYKKLNYQLIPLQRKIKTCIESEKNISEIFCKYKCSSPSVRSIDILHMAYRSLKMIKNLVQKVHHFLLDKIKHFVCFCLIGCYICCVEFPFQVAFSSSSSRMSVSRRTLPSPRFIGLLW